MSGPSSTSSAAGSWQSASRSGRVERFLLDRLRRLLVRARVRVVLWDGTELTSPDAGSATLLVRDRRTLLGVLWDPEQHFGDAYADGRLEVRGDLVPFLEATYASWQDKPWSALGRAARFVGRRVDDLAATRKDVQSHYDLGNDFYRLWLDDSLVYTCAYFERPDVTLEDAQVAKMEHVCRKLRLRPGETVIEAGCGWGALALHMARHHGVSVRAYNISSEQIRYARDRARREGLADRVEFVDADFRGIQGTADAFVSVGMLEHVGLANYRALGEVIGRCLDPVRGRGLLHFIGRDRMRPLNTWIRRRIFPGAYAPTLPQAIERVLGPCALSVLDVENLRLHYALTLDHWRRRFESAAARVAAHFDERFVRTWRLYLAGSQAAFSTGCLELFQVTFGRSRDNDVPWTRASLYHEHDARAPL
jgi:cyclopropane-fatty-acyl-phospholipid synthase